jgi:hypothetical protein
MQIRFGHLSYHNSVPADTQVEMEKISGPMTPVWATLDKQGIDINVSQDADVVNFKAKPKGSGQTLTHSAPAGDSNYLASFSQAAKLGMRLAEEKAVFLADCHAEDRYRDGERAGERSGERAGIRIGESRAMSRTQGTGWGNDWGPKY